MSSLIYIKYGVLFANIFNIDSDEVLDMFLDDYDFEHILSTKS